MAIVIGCDLHSRFQQVAVLDLETGEVSEHRLEHGEDQEQVREFYARWTEPVAVAVEATGYSRWFATLMSELGHRLRVGDAAQLRAMEPRRQKTDRRDALLLARVVASGRFPDIWVPEPKRCDLRHLILHRHRVVRMRTQVRNNLHAVAMNHGLCRKRALFTAVGLERLKALSLMPHEQWRCDQLLDLQSQLSARIEGANRELQAEMAAWPETALLMTHPGVGPVTALAWVAFIGDARRFESSARLCSYVGLVPTEASSGGRQRLGSISKQGNAFMRFVLAEAAQSAAQGDPVLRSFYRRLAAAKGRARAKVAVARKLAVRMYWMSVRGVAYPDCLKGQHMQVSSTRPMA